MIDKRKLVNVIMEDGSVVPIGNPEDYEMVLNIIGEGVIQLKPKVKKDLAVDSIT